MLLLICALTGCNRQIGYFHSTRMFTDVDRNALTLVQRSALGKPEILKSIVAEYLKEDSPAVGPCSYKVSKVVRRDLKLTDGAYAEELHVICLTSASELPFRFEWVLDQNQHLSEFKFGYDPGAVYD
jgi:hypothetical protein